MSTALQAIATDIIAYIASGGYPTGTVVLQLASNLEVLGEDFLGFAMISVRLYFDFLFVPHGAWRATSEVPEGRWTRICTRRLSKFR